MTDYTDLVARLRDTSTEKQSEAWRRIDGGQDLSIGAMLADEAADAIETLAARLDALAMKRDNIADSLRLERALTDGAHRRARKAEAQCATLEAERAKDHAEINLKADFIDKTLNQLAEVTSRADDLQARLDAVTAERDELRREGNPADHALVDRYRDPKTGVFSFPGDVAAIVRKLDAETARANAADTALNDMTHKWGEADRQRMAAEDALKEAVGVIQRQKTELDMIRMKDSSAVYDVMIRMDARAFLAQHGGV